MGGVGWLGARRGWELLLKRRGPRDTAGECCDSATVTAPDDAMQQRNNAGCNAGRYPFGQRLTVLSVALLTNWQFVQQAFDEQAV